MTTSEVYEYLESLEKIDYMLENKLQEKEELFTLATKTTQVLSHASGGGGKSDKVGNIAVKIAEIDKDIEKTIYMLLQFRKEVVDNLQKIEKAEEYEVLYLFFVSKKNANEISEYLGAKKGKDAVSRQWVQELRTRGFKSLTSFLQPSELYRQIQKMTKPIYNTCQ